MYVIGDSYDALSSFITGYCLGIRDIRGYDFAKEFQSWLRLKEKRHFSMMWSAYILAEMSDSDEELAERNLFRLLKEFIADCQNERTRPQ